MATTTEKVSKQEIRDLIVELLVEEFDIDAELITDSATMEELDLDSLDMVEIGQVAEQKFGVRVKPTDAEGVTDFGGVLDVIHRLANRTPEEAAAEEAAAAKVAAEKAAEESEGAAANGRPAAANGQGGDADGR
jgi:acyl carrier protein